MSIQALKKQSSVEKLKKAIEQSQAGNGQKFASEDTRFWTPDVDKAGNGYAIIRFLDTPEIDGEDSLPWVQLWSHSFQGPGGWYIENSLTTIGQNDPVGEYNTKLWNSGVESNKKIARDQKRKLNYISNILVISDPKHPENEGKVFLYKYGKKIFEKIKEKFEPQFEDEKPMYAFDLWNGANFKLKIRQVDGYRNYDKSEFEDQSPVAKDDNAIAAIWKLEHSLKEFVKPEKFKSYEDLQKRLNKALGNTEVPVSNASPANSAVSNTTKPKPTAETAGSTDDDDDLAFFEKMVSDNN